MKKRKTAKKKKTTRIQKRPLPMNKIGERDPLPELEMLPAGDKLHLVRSGPTVMTCMYHPERLYEEAAGWIFGFMETLRTGAPFDFSSLGSEEERKGSKAAVQYLDPELDEAFRRYIDLANQLFAGTIEQKLHELPQLLFIEVMNATVIRMKEDGYISLKGKSPATEIWNDYLDSLRVSIKNQWNAPRRGEKPNWTPEQRSEVLDYYDDILKKLQWAKNLYESEPRSEDWREKIKGKHAELDDKVIDRLIMEIPSDLAPELTGKHFRVIGEVDLEGEDYLKKQLTQAREDRGTKRKRKSKTA
jgi:hypothetical protein